MHIRLLFISLLTTIAPQIYLPAAPGYPPGRDSDQKPSIFDSFYSEDVLSITLTTDMDSLINERRRDDFQPATFEYKDSNGEKQILQVDVKPRGKFRRHVCDFPPVKMQFPKDVLKEMGFNKHNDLKLVTHCVDNVEEGELNILLEYLAYKLYNTLTPQSYRTQLVKIRYKDSKGNYRPLKRYGFIIEDTDEMADRLGGKECEDCLNPDQALLNPKEENLLSVFQYMIGNADWSMMLARNIKYVAKPDGKLIPVPYDFDFSGLVSAGYAIPSREYGLWHVQNRVFLGAKPDKNLLMETLETVRSRKEPVFSLIKSSKWLSKDAKLFANSYLGRFFFLIENSTEEELVNIFTPAERLTPPRTDTSGIN